MEEKVITTEVRFVEKPFPLPRPTFREKVGLLFCTPIAARGGEGYNFGNRARLGDAMKETLKGFYRPSDEEFQQLWKSCVFIFDTNSLLNLYRYPLEARDDLLSFLKRQAERVWIPYQVALEYQENRLSVIAEQAKRFQDVQSIVRKSIASLKGELDQLQLEKRHSAIKPATFLKKAEKLFEGFCKELEELKGNQPSVYDQDSIRDRLDVIFKGRIGAPPIDQAELDKIYDEGEARYKKEIPPGYIDPTKKKRLSSKTEYVYGGLIYKRIYGDLILWKQIVKQAKEDNKFKAIIFVTDDNTEDWWWLVDSQGEKRIGPRPELIQEISTEAGVNYFYMYGSEQFLKYANEYLGAQVKQESIEQIHKVSTAYEAEMGKLLAQEYESPAIALIAEKAVAQWLSEAFPDSRIGSQVDSVDIVREGRDGAIFAGYEVKYFRRSTASIRKLQNLLVSTELRFTALGFDECNIVFVYPTISLAAYDFRKVNQALSQMSGRIKTNLIFGALEPNNESHLGYSFIPFRTLQLRFN